MARQLSESELEALLHDARKHVSVGGYYRHYKGKQYQVIDVAILTEEVGVGVIYQAQYGAGLLFVRPLEVWLEETEHEGKRVKRFTKIAS